MTPAETTFPIVVIVTKDPGVLIIAVASVILDLAWTGLIVITNIADKRGFVGLVAVKIKL